MTYVFGNVVAELGKFPATGGESMLSSMMEVFNVAVLFLGCLYLVYISVYGQVSTAHHGQILGRAWSSVWVPIRSVIGLASLLPFVKGYSFLQCFVLWLAIQGVAAGNNLWEVMAEHMGTMGGFIAPPVDLTRFRGHLIVMEKGVYDAKNEKAVSAGIPAADGGIGARWTHARGVIARV